MREIKFRGKRTDNGEWVYGGYTKWLEGARKAHVIIARNEDGGLLDEQMTRFFVDPKTICQLTQYSQADGKGIYEGDKISVKGSMTMGDVFEEQEMKEVEFKIECVVEWCDNFSGFNLKTIRKHEYCDSWMFCAEDDLIEYEVIGNIHEEENK